MTREKIEKKVQDVCKSFKRLRHALTFYEATDDEVALITNRLRTEVDLTSDQMVANDAFSLGEAEEPKEVVPDA